MNDILSPASEALSIHVNPGYGAGQLAKALATGSNHPDEATRQSAMAKAKKWRDVLMGMRSGVLNIGSRQPNASTPIWATPEVVTGGFVTGALLAGGDLLEHERALLDEFGLSQSRSRQALNEFFLTPDGLLLLADWLADRRYTVEVPEEGALLVVAWLLKHDHAEPAEAILKEIAPFFDRLRFYPLPSREARSGTTEIFLQDVAQTLEQLRNVKPHRNCVQQREMTQVWIPLMDRLVDVFLETVEGAAPDLERDSSGNPMPVSPLGRFPTTGGWPCRHYPAGWAERAKVVLAEYEWARKQHRECQKPERADDNFQQLRTLLTLCLLDPKQLTGRDVGRIRLILARYLAKHGQPGSEQRCKCRQHQAAQVSRPLHSELAQALARRLSTTAPNDGLDDCDAVLRPILPSELSGIASAVSLPDSVQRKVRRAQRDTLHNLVASGIITSGESIARVLPKITSHIAAFGIEDEELRALMASIYRAFRKRRSLLLLNLASQVRLEELPWVKAVQLWKQASQQTQIVAAATLKEVASTTLAAFPQSIVPNRLVRELATLSKEANLALPFVEEIAADIFMGEFGAKFRDAALYVAAEMKGTLYETYYDAEFEQILKLPPRLEVSGMRQGGFWEHARQRETDAFSGLCAKRAGNPTSYRVAANGMILEQQQILTTQNLCVLLHGLKLPVDPAGAAERCFVWIIRRLQVQSDTRHAKLIMVKNAAYAWRQMIYFLSKLRPAQMTEFGTFIEQTLSKTSDAFRDAFAPAIVGLQRSIAGHSPEAPPESRRLLGWTTEQHWLLQRLEDSGAQQRV